MENMLCIYLYINYIKKIAPTQVVGKLYNTVKSMPQSGVYPYVFSTHPADL